MSANERQVGGKHYKVGGEEHWDRQWRLYGRGYFVGQITKYVERYHDKNGVQDLEKAKHFLEKLIELENAATAALKQRVSDMQEEILDSFRGPSIPRHTLDAAEKNRKGQSRFVCDYCGEEVWAYSENAAVTLHGQCAPKAGSLHPE